MLEKQRKQQPYSLLMLVGVLAYFSVSLYSTAQIAFESDTILISELIENGTDEKSEKEIDSEGKDKIVIAVLTIQPLEEQWLYAKHKNLTVQYTSSYLEQQTPPPELVLV